jgi:hypothetical protein
VLRDIRELAGDPAAYAAELRRRWTGLLSYRYIGRNHSAMNTGPADNTVTLRRDMRNAAGGLLVAPRELHDAVMQRLGEQAGVTYEGVTLDEVADVAGRVFAAMSGFAVSAWTQQVDDPTFTTIDQMRGQALRDAVEATAPRWSSQERDAAAGVLDVLWSPVSLERLMAAWSMSPERATEVIRWAIGLVVDSVRNAAAPKGGPRPARGRTA